MRCIAAFLILTSAAVSADQVDYTEDVKPLLVEKCAACHGALRQEAGLRLDASQLIRQGGDSGAVISPGAADDSILFERVAADDESVRMPPEGEGEALNDEQLALLKSWIAAGAPAPETEPVPAKPQEHWAYQALTRPEVPRTSRGTQSANPIDAFIAAEQEATGVTPFPSADRATLLRRVMLDLIGLPPTREELHAFLRDDSENAYEQIVDRLLNSPQHGERWARHWMDVWRYSDWDGYKNELRGSQRHIWRWRDWIVESLNADRSYDQMVREMLAGDELAPSDPETLRATGFLARNYHNSNRDIWLDATVEHTAKAFLGITIDCARCHDHKYDPIAQTDYYKFRAIFEPHQVRVERLPGQPDIMQDGLARAFDANPEAETYLYVGGNEKQPDKEHPLTPGIPELFGGLTDIQGVDLPEAAWFPASQDFIRDEELSTARKQLDAAQAKLEQLLSSSVVDDSSARPPVPPKPTAIRFEERLARADVRAAKSNLQSLRARWAADQAKYLAESEETTDSLSRTAAKTERSARLRAVEVELLNKQQALLTAEQEQDEAKRKKAVEKAQKEVAAAQEKLAKAREALRNGDGKYTSVGKVYPRTSTGRRLALAKWITSPENPLTSRVAVNHIWMRHFGEPLVENVFDFGLRSPRPVHANLLDWLAVDFMEGGWSMKRLHRLIVTSEAYRRASAAETALAAANRRIDPDNHLLWRAEVQRLDAEVVRDSVLAVAGSLDTTTGGPDIDFQDGEEIPRRSLYFRHAYEKQMTMLVLFDAANPTDCYRRSTSIVPQQALTLANSTLTLAQSRKLARELWDKSCSQSDASHTFVIAAFEQVLSRSPTEEETEACLTFLKAQTERLSDPSTLTSFGGKTESPVEAADDPAMRARENLVHVLMNHNDFVTVR